MGDSITEADVRLFTTLAGFDAVRGYARDINPTGVVPKGQDPATWLTLHGRG